MSAVVAQSQRNGVDVAELFTTLDAVKAQPEAATFRCSVTHALMRGAVLRLHRWGLLPAVLEAGTPPVRSTTFHLPGAARGA